LAAGVWTRRARFVFRDGKDRSFLIFSNKTFAENSVPLILHFNG